MRTIAQRELRNQSGQILREAEGGEQFLITVEGRPIALLSPCPKRQWVSRTEVLKLLRTNKPDPDFFADVAELGGLEKITDPWER
ncbi:MAG TPA: type II toxin-antitoxin system prevent-host-death family antitoxin [Thermoanaerobaculia bacterium]|jgi:prevent-host-death family protein|nr:type II toxin-antitoxin system prevent-host-death family antitoxin [Thermoanaerobaculia bacterium]